MGIFMHIHQTTQTYQANERQKITISASQRMFSKERSDFELGKKHLANMMGMDADAMTQQDIDKAIEYLFPSGLTEPAAR